MQEEIHDLYGAFYLWFSNNWPDAVGWSLFGLFFLFLLWAAGKENTESNPGCR